MYCENYETNSFKSASDSLKNFVRTGFDILLLVATCSFSCFPPNFLSWPDLSSKPASNLLRQQYIIEVSIYHFRVQLNIWNINLEEFFSTEGVYCYPIKNFSRRLIDACVVVRTSMCIMIASASGKLKPCSLKFLCIDT